MKKFLFVLIILVFGIFVYYTKLHTYFLTKKVSEEMPESASASVVAIKDGNFRDADFFHKGKGEAKIFSANSKNILRFENFDITNGPDLFVYLSDSATPGRNLESLGNFIDLGMLKGNTGNQNYELPEEIDVSKYKSVVIWCKKFGVLFPYAVFK